MKRTTKKATKKAPARSKRPKKTTAKTTVAASAVPVLIPQPHGGALRNGGPNVGGPGRPKNEIRAKLRELAYGKGLDFLSELLDGKLTVELLGECPHCGETSTPDLTKWTATLLDKVSASADQRLKANEQALRFGVGTQSEQVLSEEDIRGWEGHVARFLHDRLTAEGWTLDQVGALLSGLDEHMRAFDPRERTK